MPGIVPVLPDIQRICSWQQIWYKYVAKKKTGALFLYAIHGKLHWVGACLHKNSPGFYDAFLLEINAIALRVKDYRRCYCYKKRHEGEEKKSSSSFFHAFIL